MLSKLPYARSKMPWYRKKAALLAAGVALLVCALSVAVQLAYPSSRALPGTRLASKLVSFQDDDQVKQVLQKLDKQTFTLQLADQGYNITPSQAGLTFVNSSNVATVLSYPLDHRFIPFSIFFQHKQAVQRHLLVSVRDETQLQALAAKLAAESGARPIEGVIVVQNGQVSEHAPKPGVAFTASEIMSTLQSLHGDVPSHLAVSGNSVPSTYDAAAVHVAATQATNLIKPFTIKMSSSSFVVPAATVGSWLTFTPSPKTRSIKIGFDESAIKDYLGDISKRVYREPTTTTVTLLDNQQASRQEGVNGSYLDVAAGTTSVITALSQKSSSVTLALDPIASPVSYVYTYSDTSVGLQTLLDNWVAANSGVEWGISIAELGGKNRSAGYNATDVFMPASIYKLYVSYAAQREISAGTLNPNTKTSTGQSVETCLDVMIIDSDNPCARAVADMVGWNTATADAHAAGFTSTNLSEGNNSSTAGDTTLFLEKLGDGTLMDSTQTAALISHMKQQIYREGLPAGSSGATVADKVGFYGSYLHDAGIVYYPDHTYAISVFSYGGSWDQIADLASTISNYMSTH